MLKRGKRTPTSDMHRDLHMYGLADRCHMRTMEFMYKDDNDLLPRHICQLFQKVSNTHQRETRSATSRDYKIPNPGLETPKRDIRYRGPLFWNMVDKQIRKSPNLASFKYALRKSDLFIQN